MNPSSGTDAQSASDSSNQHVEDVRLKYHEARRDEQSFSAMQLARQVAEAVCAGVEGRLPVLLQPPYRKLRELNRRLAFLEDNEETQMPREVIAALRTLQAYGNYAAHYVGGKHRPSERATTSAMASLALVVRWFTAAGERESTAATAEVVLRDPPPQRPGLRERRRMLRRAPTSHPDLLFAASSPDGRRVICVDPAAPPEAQLAALLTYYATIAAVCEGICRVVVERETTQGLPPVGELDQISMLFNQVAEGRSARIPRSACTCLEDVLRRRMTVLRAIRERTADIPALTLEARQPDPIEPLVRWFERDYLGRGLFERRWPLIVFVPASVVFALWATYKIGEAEGWSQRNAELRARFCTGTTPSAVVDFCDTPHVPPDGRTR